MGEGGSLGVWQRNRGNRAPWHPLLWNRLFYFPVKVSPPIYLCHQSKRFENMLAWEFQNVSLKYVLLCGFLKFFFFFYFWRKSGGSYPPCRAVDVNSQVVMVINRKHKQLMQWFISKILLICMYCRTYSLANETFQFQFFKFWFQFLVLRLCNKTLFPQSL